MCVMTLMVSYSMHTHTRSRGAEAREKATKYNTGTNTFAKHSKPFYKRAVLVLSTLSLFSLACMAIQWGNGENN